MNNKNYDVYDYIYTDGKSGMGNEYGAKSIQIDVETTIAPVLLNPKEENFLENIKNIMINCRSTIGRSINIDFRLLTNEVIDLLAELYEQKVVTGIRLLPKGATFTKELYDRFNNSNFKGYLISADVVDEKIERKESYIDLIEQKRIFTTEETDILKEIDGTTYIIKNRNIHITRELTKSELEVIAEELKKSKFTGIIVDFYEPTYYKKLIDTLEELNIPKNIKIRLLANPLYDEISLYKNLHSKNNIEIFYNSCNDLNDFYRRQTHSEGEYYYSDLEASGKTSLATYNDMLKRIDEIVEHMNKKGYSQLEKVAYVYDYFKENFIYNPEYENEAHADNADLDKVFKRDRMVCEGFSNLFSAILRRAGVLCFTYGTDNHQKNIVRIKDANYDVDNIAILDITFDLNKDHNNKNTNNFENFLVSLKDDLYSRYGEVIDIPTSLFLDQETYEKYVGISKPLYVNNPLAYAIRMLQLMGLIHQKDIVFNSEKEFFDYYREAIHNSELINLIPEDAIAKAVTSVRNREGKYKKFKESMIDYQDIISNTKFRGNSQAVPMIRLFNSDEIVEVEEYKPVIEEDKTKRKVIKFDNIQSQNNKLSYPRKRMEEESQSQYEEYLHRFYHDRFISKSSDYIEEEIEEITQELSTDDIRQVADEILESTRTEDLSLEEIKEEADASMENIKDKTEVETDALTTEDIKAVTDELFAEIASEKVEEEGLTSEEIKRAADEALAAIRKPEITPIEEKSEIEEELTSEEIKGAADEMFAEIASEKVEEEGLSSEEIKRVADEALAAIRKPEITPIEVKYEAFKPIEEKSEIEEELTSEKVEEGLTSEEIKGAADEIFAEIASEKVEEEGLTSEEIKRVADEALAAIRKPEITPIEVKYEAFKPIEEKSEKEEELNTTEKGTTNNEIVSDEELRKIIAKTINAIENPTLSIEDKSAKNDEELSKKSIQELTDELMESLRSNTTSDKKEETIENPVKSEPVVIEEETIVNPVKSEPVVIEEETIVNPVKSEPVVIEEETIVNPVKSEPVVIEEETIVNPVKPEPEVTEEEPIEKPVKSEPVVIEEETIVNPVEAEPEATEEEPIEQPVEAEPEATEEEPIEKPVKSEPVVIEEETIEQPVEAEPEVTEEEPIEQPVEAEPVVTEEEKVEQPVEAEPEVTEEEPVEQPVETEPEVTEEEPEVKEIPETSKYKPMTTEEIEQARINIEAEKYEDLYSRNRNEFLPGTDVLKPRERFEEESEEEYNEYLRCYMDSHFEVDQPEEYIPGTTILKPRNRGIYETDEEYEEYLRMYYDYCFNNEISEEIVDETDNDTYETVTLYVDEEAELFYVNKYVVERYELESACFPALIDGVYCYRISREDAKRLVENGNTNITPYKVEMELFARVYERTDEDYTSFDKPKTLTR